MLMGGRAVKLVHLLKPEQLKNCVLIPSREKIFLYSEVSTVALGYI